MTPQEYNKLRKHFAQKGHTIKLVNNKIVDSTGKTLLKDKESGDWYIHDKIGNRLYFADNGKFVKNAHIKPKSFFSKIGEGLESFASQMGKVNPGSANAFVPYQSQGIRTIAQKASGIAYQRADGTYNIPTASEQKQAQKELRNGAIATAATIAAPVVAPYLAPGTVSANLIGNTAAGLATSEASNMLYKGITGSQNGYMEDAFNFLGGNRISNPYVHDVSKFILNLFDPAFYSTAPARYLIQGLQQGEKQLSRSISNLFLINGNTQSDALARLYLGLPLTSQQQKIAAGLAGGGDPYPELTRFLELGKQARQRGLSAPVVDWIEQSLRYGQPEELSALNAAVAKSKTASPIRDFATKVTPEFKSGTSSTSFPTKVITNNRKIIKDHNKASDIKWDADEWFISGGRSKTGPAAYTPNDVATFENHVANEYIPLQKSLLQNGSLRKNGNYWEGIINGKYVRVDPNEYIIANSSAFKKSGLYYDGQSFYSGVPSKYLDEFTKTGGLSVENWASTNKGVSATYGSRVGGKSFNLVSKSKPVLTLDGTGKRSNSFGGIGRPIGSVLGQKGLRYGQTADVLNYIDDLTLHFNPSGNAIGTSRIFMPGVQVKSLRGNNGNFNMEYKSPFAYNNDQNDQNNLAETYYA